MLVRLQSMIRRPHKLNKNPAEMLTIAEYHRRPARLGSYHCCTYAAEATDKLSRSGNVDVNERLEYLMVCRNQEIDLLTG